jgi:hypothetical protein
LTNSTNRELRTNTQNTEEQTWGTQHNCTKPSARDRTEK